MLVTASVRSRQLFRGGLAKPSALLKEMGKTRYRVGSTVGVVRLVMNPGSKLIAKRDLPCQLPVRVNSGAFHCLACSCWVVGSSAVGSACRQPAVSLWSPSGVVLQLLRHQQFSSALWVISVGLQLAGEADSEQGHQC